MSQRDVKELAIYFEDLAKEIRDGRICAVAVVVRSYDNVSHRLATKAPRHLAAMLPQMKRMVESSEKEVN